MIRPCLKNATSRTVCALLALGAANAALANNTYRFTYDFGNRSIGEEVEAGWTLNPGALPEATAGTEYEYDFSALVSGGTPTLTWGATGLPSEFTLNATTGRLVTTPDASGDFTFTVTATDALSASRQQTYVVSVKIDATGWSAFAIANEIEYDAQWNHTDWAGTYFLTTFPTSPFPNSNPTGNINFTTSANLVTDLDNFSTLRTVGGSFSAGNANFLTNIDGLSNLSSVGGSLTLKFHSSLKNLDGLSSLKTANFINFQAGSIEDISGLSALESVDNLYLRYQRIVSTAALAGTTITGKADFTGTSTLRDLSGFAGRTVINGLNLYDTNLIDVSQLSSLQTVNGDLELITMKIDSVEGLSSLTTVTGTLNIGGTPMTSLHGLENLRSVGDFGLIGTGPINRDIVDISALAGITSVDNNIRIRASVINNPGFVPIPRDAWLCQPAQASKFVHYTNPLTQAQACQWGLNSATLDNAPVGVAYSYDFSSLVINAHVDPGLAWSSTALPAGLSLNSSTGVLSGTPSATGTTSITITASDGTSPVSKTYNLTVEGLSPWVAWASGIGFTFGADGNNLSASSKGITALPAEAYPNANPTGSINLSSNSISSIASLSSLVTVTGALNLGDNSLTSLAGLEGLTQAGNLILNSNPLASLDELSALETVGNIELMDNTSLTDLSGLSNVRSSGLVFIDPGITFAPGFVKISKLTTPSICDPANASKFLVASQASVCE